MKKLLSVVLVAVSLSSTSHAQVIQEEFSVVDSKTPSTFQAVESGEFEKKETALDVAPNEVVTYTLRTDVDQREYIFSLSVTGAAGPPTSDVFSPVSCQWEDEIQSCKYQLGSFKEGARVHISLIDKTQEPPRVVYKSGFYVPVYSYTESGLSLSFVRDVRFALTYKLTYPKELDKTLPFNSFSNVTYRRLSLLAGVTVGDSISSRVIAEDSVYFLAAGYELSSYTDVYVGYGVVGSSLLNGVYDGDPVFGVMVSGSVLEAIEDAR